MMPDLKKAFNRYSFFLILLLGVVLRFYQIGKRDFWYDEAFTGIAVKERFGDMISMIINDVHPPLYYAFLKIFASFFDYSVIGIRLFSVIFGILGMWVVYVFTKELFNRKAALYASFITAVSPFAIQYSQEARMYTMFVFLAVLSAWFFIRGLKTNRLKYYLLWGVFLGLSSLTHYMGLIFALIFYPVFLIWKVYRGGELHKEVKLGVFLEKIMPNKGVIYGYGAAFLVFLPWIPNFLKNLKQAQQNNLGWILPASLGDIMVNIQMFLFGTPLGEMSAGMPSPNEFYGVAGISALIVLTVFLSLAVIYLFKREKEKAVMLFVLSIGLMFLVYAISLCGKHYFVARYLLPAAYFIFVMLGVWLSRIKPLYAYLTLGVYVLLIATISPLGYSQGWNEMVKSADKYQTNNFYILNSFDYVISKYYLGSNRLILYNIDWPQYNPDYWAAIGSGLKRTENFDDLRNDPKALIISNTQLKRDNKTFDPKDLILIDQYGNILIYRFR